MVKLKAKVKKSVFYRKNVDICYQIKK